ncbi:MAG TPA: transcription antitermination protein NusB [Acidimicrobiales bacterium]
MQTGDARHLSRERALEILYESAMKGVAPSEALGALPTRPDPFVVELVENAERAKDVAEAAIAVAAPDWPIERLAVIDRLVMVLAIGEVLGAAPPPDAVILDEAVELAKTYSTDASPRFVNGVLAAVLPTLTRSATDAPTPTELDA